VIATDVPFWPTVGPAFLAAVLAGAVLLGVGYVLIDRRLSLGERAERGREEAERESALRDAALRIAKGELQFVAARTKTYANAISNGKVPYPAFDTNGWTLLTQAHVLATIQTQTAEDLMSAYNRVRSTNEQIAEFADLTLGSTAAILAASLAGSSDESGNFPPLVEQTYQNYERRKADLEKALVARLGDLRHRVDAAIDAIERELGAVGFVPSAQQEYDAGPVHDLTDDD
jgi:hypothetical protein